MITDSKITEVFSLIDDIKKNKKNILDYDLYDLVGIYKSELYDTRNDIIKRQNRYIYKTINSLCSAYNVKTNNSNIEDFISEIKLYLIKFIDRTFLNREGQIVRYMDLTVKGYFRKYLKMYRKQRNNISISNPKYQNNKGSSKERTIEDTLADPINQYEQEEISFSTEMMNILKTLPQEDLTFLLLKYQENYSDEELSDYLNISIDELKEKEIRTLSSLKENDNIKTMRKIKDN